MAVPEKQNINLLGLLILFLYPIFFFSQLDFGPAMKQWYSGAVDSQPDLCDNRRSSDSGHMEIAIHNYSTPVDCCMNPLCIVGCFPFWLLLGGPCYCVSQNCQYIHPSPPSEKHLTFRFTDLGNIWIV